MVASMTVNVPHLDIPPRIGSDGHMAVVEQGSTTDIENCAEMVIRTYKGERIYAPDFGIDDPTFELQPIDIGAIENSIAKGEPRAIATLSQTTDNLVAKVKAELDAS